MVKLDHIDVEYEHPAAKSDHCGICRHYEPPAACEIVKSPISPKDWCNRFRKTAARTIYVGVLLWAFWPSLALAVNANPVPGSIWTWFGPTLGADWATNTGSACNNLVSPVWGAVGDGVTDNSVALRTALQASPCALFPPGKFKFTSPFSFFLSGTYAALSIIGAGSGLTEFIGPSTGNLFTYVLNGQFNVFHFRGFSAETPTACTACVAISVTQAATTTSEGYTPQSDFEDVALYGTDRDLGSGVNYWGTGIYLNGMSNVAFERVFSQGLSSSPVAATNGIFADSTSSNTPVIFNLHNVTINNTKQGLLLNQRVQGVTVSQSNFTNDQYGIYDPAGSGTGSQLSVSLSQFAANYGIYLNAAWGGVQIANNQFLIGQVGPDTNRFGVILGTTAQYATVTGNTFSGTTVTNTSGVVAAGLANSGVIEGNQFGSLGVGVTLNPNATGWIVNPNHYVNNTFNIVNNQPFGNVINNEVGGAMPSLSGSCGTGAAFSSGATDQSGQIFIGTSPGTHCDVTFSKPFVGNPICLAQNTTSLARPVTPLFVTGTSMQLSSTGALASADFLQYHCDGYQ